MFTKRLKYIFIFIAIIGLGLLSRKITGIPFFIGDVLYASMMYFLIRILLVRKSHIKVSLIALSLCFLIEISQLCQADWINAIRGTGLGRLTLGSGFLWSDLVAYTAGVLVAVFTDLFIFSRKL
jgi:hypothetical protein